MNIEIDRDIKIDALHRALLAGGFRIQTLPGGKYRLVQVSHGTAVCDLIAAREFNTAQANHKQGDYAQYDRELAAQIDALFKEAEVFDLERQHTRACLDNAMSLLNGIHALLYPAPNTTEDGRTMVFRPKDIDPHEVLQELSNRIRALPDEIAKLGRGIY